MTIKNNTHLELATHSIFVPWGWEDIISERFLGRALEFENIINLVLSAFKTSLS